MEEKLQKYASLLVRYCLKLKENQPLLIVGNNFTHDFMMIVKQEAEKLSCPVFLQEKDEYEVRDFLLTHSYEECVSSPLFDRHLYNEMAKQGGAILMLSSPVPNINDGVDTNLLGRLANLLEERISEFREKQMKGEIPWCIAAVANEPWASKILPNSKYPMEDLWNLIFDICHISSDNPELEWDGYFGELQKRTDMLNQFGISSLHYRSENGTDITFELPEDYQFASASMGSTIVNMPSLEIFTSPRRDGVNGIVKSSKPLFYQDVLIDDFWLRFEHGRVVEYDAIKGKEMLQQLIETDDGSHYLGELALVDYDSKINQSGVIFENTLYDENASCHLALGNGFPECFLDGLNKSKEDLMQQGMNVSSVHVDFMIGTRDLEIVATLQDGSEVLLMKHGKLIF